MQRRLTILHTNDIHGHSLNLARAITVIENLRQTHREHPVLYFDAGDVEDTSNRLSNLTKGRSMHRLLGLANPDAAVVGNGSLLRYGYHVLAEHAQALGAPLLLANVLMPYGAIIPGLRAVTILDAGKVRLGVIGVTAPIPAYARFFGLQLPDPAETISTWADKLQESNVQGVVVLSHLGLEADRELAAVVQGKVVAIIGGHSHHLLPSGEWIGEVLIAQAGNYAEHVGQIDLVWDGNKLQVEDVSVVPVSAETPPAPILGTEETAIEAEVEAYLDEIIGELADALDWSAEHECGVGNLMADALRHRMKADVGLVVVGQAFKGGLPDGPLSRRALWEVCDSSANPGSVVMTGAQLETMINHGLDSERSTERPGALRGRARGLMHISGASRRDGIIYVGQEPLRAEETYHVAASDFELEEGFGYASPEWQLKPIYHTPTILREALSEYLAADRPTRVKMNRL